MIDKILKLFQRKTYKVYLLGIPDIEIEKWIQNQEAEKYFRYKSSLSKNATFSIETYKFIVFKNKKNMQQYIKKSVSDIYIIMEAFYPKNKWVTDDLSSKIIQNPDDKNMGYIINNEDQKFSNEISESELKEFNKIYGK